MFSVHARLRKHLQQKTLRTAYLCLKQVVFELYFVFSFHILNTYNKKLKALSWVNFEMNWKSSKPPLNDFLISFLIFKQLFTVLFFKKLVSIISFLWHDSPIWHSTVHSQQRDSREIYSSGLANQLYTGFSHLQVLIMT